MGYLPINTNPEVPLNKLVNLSGIFIFSAFTMLVVLDLIHLNKPLYMNEIVNMMHLLISSATFFGSYFAVWMTRDSLKSLMLKYIQLNYGMAAKVNKFVKIKKSTILCLVFFVFMSMYILSYLFFTSTKQFYGGLIISLNLLFSSFVIVQLYLFSQLLHFYLDCLNNKILKQISQIGLETDLRNNKLLIDSNLKLFENRYYLLRNACTDFRKIFQLPVLLITINCFSGITIQQYYLICVVDELKIIIGVLNLIFVLSIHLCLLFYCHQLIINRVRFLL